MSKQYMYLHVELLETMYFLFPCCQWYIRHLVSRVINIILLQVFGDTKCFFIQNSKNKEVKEKHQAKLSKRSAKHSVAHIAGKIDIENINNNNTSKTRTASEINHNQSIQDNHLSKDSQGGTGSHVEDMGQANADTDTIDKPKEVVSNKGNNVEGDEQEIDTASCKNILDGETQALYKLNNPERNETYSNKDNVNVVQNGVEGIEHCDNRNIGTMITAESLEHKPTHSEVEQMMNNTEKESNHSIQDERSDDKSMEPITKKQKVAPQSYDLEKNVSQLDDLERKVPQSDDLERNVPQSDDFGRKVSQADDLERNEPQSDDLERNIPQSDDLGRNVPQSDDLGRNVPKSCDSGKEIAIEVARYLPGRYPKLYYPSSQVLHKKRTSSVESANKQSIYQHFTMTKRQLSLDSALRIEHKARPTNTIEFPFPVQSINEHRIKAGVKLGLYDQRTLEKLEKSRKSSKNKLPNLTND